MTEWKPGTVATATVHGEENVRVMKKDGGPYWSVSTGGAVVSTGKLRNIRPLVVLDLDDPLGAAAYLREATDGFENAAYQMQAWSGRNPLRKIAAQIEAQAKPAKPAEPKGWGAVIEDSRGRYWTLVNPAEGIWSESTGIRNQYDRLSPVRVVSEGVDV